MAVFKLSHYPAVKQRAISQQQTNTITAEDKANGRLKSSYNMMVCFTEQKKTLNGVLPKSI